jgi:hypothetical protein
MTSILKVDTIQDTAGNNIINESGDTITIGASGDTITIPSGATISNLGTASGFGEPGKFESALLHVRDEKSAGTQSGSVSSGSWVTRPLNTVKTNEISGASLSSNQIILPTGTYYINANGTSYKVNENVIKLRNITDSSDTIIGMAQFAWDGDESTASSFLTGRFTIASSKTFELQFRVTATNSTNGFGVMANVGVTEVYSDVQIWKVA